MNHQEGTFLATEQTNLFYQSWLPEDRSRAVLVISHGLGEHGGRYMNVVNHLVPRGFAVYALDYRGHGRSPGQRGHLQTWSIPVEDLRAFITFVQAQNSGLPLFLLGQSLGGNIALTYALRYPDGLAGVIAMAPALDTGDVPPLMAFLSKVLYRIKPDLSVKVGLDISGLSRDTAVVEAYKNDPLVHEKGTPGAAIAFTESVAWVMDHAAELKPPLLILHGEADRIVKPESSRLFFDKVAQTDKTRITYPDGYHESHNDLHQAQMVADLEKWLEAHM